MAEVDSTAPAEVGATADPINDLFHESSYFWGRMNAFFEFVEREIEEQNSTDLDGIAFLVKGAKTEFDGFTKLISKTDQALEERGNQNVTPDEKSRTSAAQNDKTKTVIRSASGGPLYALAEGAERNDIQSTLSAKLGQLEAMLMITYGCGAETFQNWSSEIQDNYMWSCANLAKECGALAEL